MEEEQETNYASMSLDDVIRSMHAKKKALEEENGEDNSPFLRQKNNFQLRRPRTFQPRYDERSNYRNHMARKKLAQARRTLDLRQRLISIRASKQGLDLRWKLVANVISKLRLQAKSSRQRFQTLPQMENPHGPLFDQCGGMISQHKVNRSTITQIEKLVGRLPPWMKAPAVNLRAPAVPHNPSPSGVFQMRTVPRVFSPPKCCHHHVRQHTHAAVPNHVHSCCQPMHNVPNYYQTDVSEEEYEMPPLACDIPCHTNGMPPLARDAAFHTNRMPPLARDSPCYTNGMPPLARDSPCYTNGMPPLATDSPCYTNGMPPLASDNSHHANGLSPSAYDPSQKMSRPGISQRLGVIDRGDDYTITVLNDVGDDAPQPRLRRLSERFGC